MGHHMDMTIGITRTGDRRRLALVALYTALSGLTAQRFLRTQGVALGWTIAARWAANLEQRFAESHRRPTFTALILAPCALPRNGRRAILAGMDATAPQTNDARPARPRRRWFRYSLRTLLAAVTLVALALGVWVHRAERQRRAVAAIRDMGGHVFYDFERLPEFDPTTGELVFDLPAPAWMMNGLGWDYFADVTVVILSYSNMTDERMPLLKAFPEMKRFQIGTDQRLAGRPVQVTDASIELLASFTSLKYVNLSGAQVSAKGVDRLQQALPNCEIVR
jgi:hypothetical protein